MTRFSRYSLYLALAWLVISISCRKEYSCEKCNENKPPIANAGSDAKLLLPLDSLMLDGTASSDRDGKIIAWEWTKISGPVPVTISFPKAVQTRVKHLVKGQYQFELKVTDDGGLSSRDTLQVTVDSTSASGSSSQGNRPPVANAGPDQNVLLPSNHTILNGSASSDPDNNIISYRWVKVAGPSSFSIDNPSSAVMEVRDLVQGSYSFELLVTDAAGAFSRDTVQVIAKFLSGNIPPVADAGVDQKRILRSTRIPLDGSASHDPDGIIMGSIWSQIKGPNIAQITHVNLPVSSIVGFVEGIYYFRLEVTDDKGAKDDDTVRIEFVRDTLSGKTIIYDVMWGCNDVCQDGDVYWTSQLDPGNPLLYFDPNIPLEVSVFLDTSTVWIPVRHRDSSQPPINQFFYFVEREWLWVYAYDAKLIGKAVKVRVKFL